MDQCGKRAKLAKEQLDRTNVFREAVGLQIPEEEPKQPAKTWSELVEFSKLEQKKKEDDAKDNTKHWSKKVQVKDRSKNIEKVKKDTEKDKKVKVLKINESSSHGEEDWSWEECREDWEGTEDKKENKKLKKIQRYRKKKLLQSKTSLKAKHMIGLGPIRHQSIGFFYDITSDYEEAKVMAANEFLCEYLQLTEEDIKDFEIVETMLAKNEDDLLYITFNDHESIREIYRRTADLRNDEIMTRIFVPPQFWDRYRSISLHCTKLRESNKDIKTQIRFGDNDIEVVIKDRATKDHYSPLPLAEIEKVTTVPRFNHDIVWRKRTDRAPRNATKVVTTKVVPPSIQNQLPSRHSSSSSNENHNPTKRMRKNKDTPEDNLENENHVMEHSDKDLVEESL